MAGVAGGDAQREVGFAAGAVELQPFEGLQGEFRAEEAFVVRPELGCGAVVRPHRVHRLDRYGGEHGGEDVVDAYQTGAQVQVDNLGSRRDVGRVRVVRVSDQDARAVARRREAAEQWRV